MTHQWSHQRWEKGLWFSGGPAGTDPDTYDADHGRAMDMAVARYTKLYGEAPEAEIMGKLGDGERSRRR